MDSGVRRRKPAGSVGDVEQSKPQLSNDNSRSTSRSRLKNCLGICGLFTMFACCGLALAIIFLLYTRLGFGIPSPDQGYGEMKAILSESALEIVAELPAPAGNIAVSQSGRIFFNFHPV